MAEYRIPLGYVRGPAGTAGKDFEFKKTYATVAAMNADFSGTDTSTGDYVLISAGSSDDADNGRMYRKGESTWVYVARINGPTGPAGQRGPMPPLVTDLNVTVAGEGALDAAVGPRIAERLVADGGDAAENMVTFTSSDTDQTASITSFETMPVFATGTNRLKALFATISKAVKNIRYLIKLMGTTDISGINNGTVTGILPNLNSNKFDKANVTNNLTTTAAGYALDARQGRALSTSVNSLNDSITSMQTRTACTVVTANSSVITHTSGYAYCFPLGDSRVVVYMDIVLKTTSARGAGGAAFYLTVNNKKIRILRPAGLPCIVNSDGVMRFSGVQESGNIRYITHPVAWEANKTFYISGVFAADLVD